MTVYTDTPQPTDNRNVSQGNLLNNNRYLLNVSTTPSTGILPVDHLATGNSSSSPSDGFHKQVSLINQSAISSLTNPTNSQTSNQIVYSVVDSGGAGVARTQLKSFTGDNATNVTTYLSDLKAAGIFSWNGAAVVTTNLQNIATITRSGTGVYAVTFSYTFPFTTYTVVTSCKSTVTNHIYLANSAAHSVTGFTLGVFDVTLGLATDDPVVGIQIYGYW